MLTELTIATAPPAAAEPHVAAPPRCEACGDVIGIYEPLLLRDGARLRQTSLAAEPDLLGATAARYHRACGERLA